jgi:hypothetical protein
MLYIDYVGDGFWVLGDKIVNGEIAFPRLQVCRCLRRVVSHARVKHFGEQLIISEVAMVVLSLETWRFEGWEREEEMFAYLRLHAKEPHEV